MSTRTSSIAGFLLTSGLGLAALVLLPFWLDSFSLMQATLFAAIGIFALSQGFLWGYAGILSFGQASFFGLGAYTYAVAAINLGDSTGAIVLAVLIPAGFAALLGYFMFFGRISDAYVGVITLTVSVILYELLNSTSGSQYRIGSAQLGGFNGIPALPPFNVPGEPEEWLTESGMWRVAMGALLLVYVTMRALLATRFGRILVAIRENETRAMLVGYDVRVHKVLAFAFGGAVAGLGGCIYACWGGFISPTVFALTMSAQAIVSVLLGGIGTLVGPILGAVVIQSLVNVSGTQNVVDPNLGLGIVLVTFVVLVPQGLLPAAAAILSWLIMRVRRTRSTSASEVQS
ncbi:MAG TPA: branched-chain amino acid ABC transporter permease [Xanthobacteraceae bacterium]|nr:branched-chain amino acid ABC transporter permease [Xanthobacteraceae bacterium]